MLKVFTCKKWEDEVNRKGYSVKRLNSCMQFLGLCWDSWGKYKRLYKLQYAKYFYLQEMRGLSELERISCQTPILMLYLDSWQKYKRWLKLHYLMHKKLSKKLYLQEMWGWIEREGISYRTPLLRIKKFLLRRKLKN